VGACGKDFDRMVANAPIRRCLMAKPTARAVVLLATTALLYLVAGLTAAGWLPGSAVGPLCVAVVGLASVSRKRLD
jgi:hypothetical protein